MKMILHGLSLVLMMAFAQAEPTESREWVSVTGSKVSGSALSVKAGKVLMKLANGRELAVPLDKLSAEDQEFLAGHFGEQAVSGKTPAGEPSGSGLEFVTDGLPQKIGGIEGPIASGGGSNYFLYIPKTLRKGRLAPLLHINDAGGGNARSPKSYIEGAEINGWIVVASVESKNGSTTEQNHEHAKNIVKHVLESLPVDPKRIYFSGMSGGGAMSFYNAANLPGAGAIPQIGYIPDGATSKGGHFFVCNGTTDYNRYASATAVKSLGKDAIHRFHVGGHSAAPEWLRTEGMVWLNGRYLAKNKRSSELADECLDYEAAVISWIGKLAATERHRAYFWCVFLRDEYKISGKNAAVLEPITAKLAGNPECLRYVEGIKDISEFSEKYYTSSGSGSAFNNTNSKIEAASEKLAQKYAGVPMIEGIAAALGKPTVGK